MNIGIHFFDLLIWLFGSVQQQEIYLKTNERMGGFIELEKANIEWFLSINVNDIPNNSDSPIRTYRSITIDGEEIEFSGGFSDLHTRVYKDILSGGGFCIPDARPSIEVVNKIRNLPIVTTPKNGSLHHSIKKILNLI